MSFIDFLLLARFSLGAAVVGKGGTRLGFDEAEEPSPNRPWPWMDGENRGGGERRPAGACSKVVGTGGSVVEVGRLGERGEVMKGGEEGVV